LEGTGRGDPYPGPPPPRPAVFTDRFELGF
jgi:hypothetical protein